MKNLNQNKKNPFSRVFSFYTKKDKILVFLSILFVIFSVVSDLLNPFFTQKIIQNITDNSDKTHPTNVSLSPSDIQWYYFGILAGLAIASVFFQIISMLLAMKTGTNCSSSIRLTIFKHTRYLPSQDIDKIGNASILTRTTSDVSQVEQFLINYNVFIVKAILMSLGSLGLSIYQLSDYVNNQGGNSNVWYVVSAYGLIIIFIIVIGFVMRKVTPNFDKSRKAIDVNNKAMQENIVGYKTIRNLNLEDIETKKYEVGNKNLKDITIKSEKVIAYLVPGTFFVLNIAMVAIYLFGGLYTNGSTVDNFNQAKEVAGIVGIVISFSQYLIMTLLGLILFSTFGYTLSRARVSAIRIFSALDIKSSINEIENPLEIDNGKIEFKNVCFKYFERENSDGGDEDTNTIENVSFKINSGETLGIIGETGSGKSTIVKLLNRLYDVNSGEILISDKNIKDLSIKSIRNNISVSLQEKILLKGTFKSNIKIGDPEASDEKVIEAAKDAQAWEFISNKENGIDGIVEERGSNLSGGQKQRVSIARALIKKMKILVFDDSTSALDTITEAKIMKTLQTKFKGVTKIIISQKTRSIMNADKILVLDSGKVKQFGTHKELMKDKKGTYYKIYQSQNTMLEG